VGAYDSSITGTIRVANLCYNKTVTVRYTINKWVTFDDVIASYILGSNDGTTDRYSFSISLPKSITLGSRLELAIRYDAVDINRTYWDNNFEDNYCFECYARSVPVRESDFAWLHFL
jgi:protein phosphatase 1 regulatory subunit 3A/B/C/D/E